MNHLQTYSTTQTHAKRVFGEQIQKSSRMQDIKISTTNCPINCKTRYISRSKNIHLA
jgi:hypothetical protein